MTWRFLDSGPAPGPRQMAIDEALLEAVAHGRSPPLLRLFAFQPLCLSLGRFQAARGRWGAEARDGLDLVRRPTGGRAVLHYDDLCYAVIASTDDPNVGGGIRDSYCRIAQALSRALALLGAPEVHFSAAHGGNGPALRGCFASCGPFELTVKGAKVLGNAQVRRGPALLQQGSLRLERDPQRERLLLDGSGPSLSDLLGRRVGYEEAAAALRRAFADAFNITLEGSALSRDEMARAAALEHDKYANPRWTWQR